MCSWELKDLLKHEYMYERDEVKQPKQLTL